MDFIKNAVGQAEGQVAEQAILNQAEGFVTSQFSQKTETSQSADGSKTTTTTTTQKDYVRKGIDAVESQIFHQDQTKESESENKRDEQIAGVIRSQIKKYT